MRSPKAKAHKALIRQALWITGCLSLIYGTGVVAIIGYSHWFDGIWFATGAGSLVLAGPAWPFISGHKAPSKICRAILAIALVSFLLLEGVIACTAVAGPEPEAAYAIILGAGVNGTIPSITLSRRIQSGAEYIEYYPDTMAVATGGQGPGEHVSEASVIVRELTHRGIAPDRILAESESTTTKENLLFAKRAIESKGGSAEDPIVIVSSSFHLFRAMRLAKKVGFSAVSGLGSPSMRYLELHYFVREAAAVVKEKLDGNI